MKYLLPITIFILLTGFVAADSCEIRNLCYNQDEQTFCSPQDETCEFMEWTELGENCVVEIIELDSDDDGWSDSCDALAENPDEWLDFDADGIGHNSDCDDLDEEIGLCEEETSPDTNSTIPTNITINESNSQNNVTNITILDVNTNVSETNTTENQSTSKHPSSGGASEFELNGDVKIIEKEEKEEKEIEPENQVENEEKTAQNQQELYEEEQRIPNEIIPVQKENSPNKQNLLTGAVIGGGEKVNILPIVIIIFALAALILILLFRRRRKNN